MADDVKYVPEVENEAKLQMERLPGSAQEQVARTLALLVTNPYLTGTELVGTTKNTEIRRTQAAPSVLMQYEFPTKPRANARSAPKLRVLSLMVTDL